MTTLDEQLEQSGTSIRSAFQATPTPGPQSIKRRHQRQRTRTAAVLTAALLLAGFGAFRSLTASNSQIGPASGAVGEIPAFGLDLGAPWIASEIYHNDGAYDVDYWETYYYLSTEDNEASSVVARITTRRATDDEVTRSGVAALSGQDASETVIDGRSVGVSVGPDGNYSYAWFENGVLVDVVVIQMAPDTVTRELAETVLGNVRTLTTAELNDFIRNQTLVPSGPPTSLGN